MENTNMGFNIRINDLKSNLINTINKSELPVGVIYYLLKDLLGEIADSYKQALTIERQVKSITESKEEN